MPNPWNVALHLLIRPRSFERLQSVSSPSSCREVLRLTLPPLKPHFAIVSTVIRITALLELLRSRARSTFPYVLVLAGEALQVCEASFVSLGGRQRHFHLQTPPSAVAPSTMGILVLLSKYHGAHASWVVSMRPPSSQVASGCALMASAI